MRAQTALYVRAAVAACLLLWAVRVDAASRVSHMRLNSRYRFEDILITSEDESVFDPKSFATFSAFLTRFSQILALSTEGIGRRISAEVIRVRVPSSKVAGLKAAGYAFVPATWESAQEADIILKGFPFDSYLTIPADECYGQSERILMPSSDTNAYKLVREFAKYRWGVLNETDDATPPFYMMNGDVRPSVCSPDSPVTYTVLDTTRNEKSTSGDIADCAFEMLVRDTPDFSDTGLAQACRVFPNDNQPDADKRASILFQVVQQFCDNSTGTARSHNTRVLNAHNRMCGGKSAAEVILAHTDFASGLAGTPTNATTPTVLLIEPNAVRRIVLVMDISTSMQQYPARITNLRRTASMYVKYFVETGAEVAILTFNESVHLVQPMTKVSNDSVRQMLSDKIQAIVARGSTDISDAITQAMALLGATKPYGKNQTGFVVLLTDGVHNIGPSLDDAISNASLTSIVFDTVTISFQADARMQRLSSSTGGFAMFSSQNVPVNTELEENFAKLSQRSENASQGMPVLLRTSVVTLPISALTVTVEPSVTKSLYFMIYLPNLDVTMVNFTARNPVGKLYGSFSGSTVYVTDTVFSTILIKISESEITSGTWTLEASSSTLTGRRKRRAAYGSDILKRSKREATSSTGSVVVIGGTSGGSLSINMDVWLRTPTFSQVTVESVQKIYAYITSNSAAITNAVVQASIVPANGSAFSVTLYDDGLGTDLTARDGIYVAQILPDKLNTTGDYAVTVNMTSPVSRVASAGKFRVEALATGPVTLPPGRVVDLAIAVSFKNQSLAVRFTSPGGQSYDATSPASYELRASNSFDQVAANFDSALLIARLLGQPSGSKVQATLWPSNFSGVQTNTTFYLAVLSTSAAGLRGQASFPIGASFSPPSSWVKALARRASGNVVSAPQSSTTTERPSTVTPDADPWTPGTVAGVAFLTTVLVAQCVVIVAIAVIV